jgi:hypothetical protein
MATILVARAIGAARENKWKTRGISVAITVKTSDDALHTFKQLGVKHTLDSNGYLIIYLHSSGDTMAIFKEFIWIKEK